MCDIGKLYEKVNYTLFMVQSQLCLILINQSMAMETLFGSWKQIPKKHPKKLKVFALGS